MLKRVLGGVRQAIGERRSLQQVELLKTAVLKGKSKPRRVVLLLLLLAAAWLLWSGLYKAHLLALGAFSCALVMWLATRMEVFRQPLGLYLLPRLPLYWLWVFRDVVTSSFAVAKIVLDPKLPISPTVVDIKAEPAGEIGQAVLGNSITLSPGTVTLDVHESIVRVHCLTQESARDLQAGEVNRRTARLADS